MKSSKISRKNSLAVWFSIGVIFLIAYTSTVIINSKKQVSVTEIKQMKNSYAINVFKETQDNTYFRKVLFTGGQSQLVVMDIKPGEDIGEETHVHTEQTLFLLNGQGKSILNGVEKPFNKGDVVVVTPGTKHNFVNTGTGSLKIFTIYTPPNHIDGRIHKTKQDAVTDNADEDFGNQTQ